MFDAPTLSEGQIVGNGDVRHVSYGNDAGLYAEFRMESVYQEFASSEAGKPVFEQVPFVRIYVPGDKTKVVDRPVRYQAWGDAPPDPQRFPQQWAAFQAGQKAEQAGLPLTEFPMITASQIKELHALNIYTVEQLAAVHDGALDGLGHGGRSLRDQARLHLDRANDAAVTTRWAREKEEMLAQIDALKAMVEEKPSRRKPAE